MVTMAGYFGTYFRCMHAYEKVEIGNYNFDSMVADAFSALHCSIKSKNISSYSLAKKFMIRESEVKYYITNNVPALAVQLSHIKDNNDVYRAIDCLTCYTKELIREDRLSEIQACFHAAFELLHEGNRLIQLAVENMFIYSVSRLLEISLNVTQPIRTLFLNIFKKEYCKQINSKHP